MVLERAELHWVLRREEGGPPVVDEALGGDHEALHVVEPAAAAVLRLGDEPLLVRRELGEVGVERPDPANLHARPCALLENELARLARAPTRLRNQLRSPVASFISVD